MPLYPIQKLCRSRCNTLEVQCVGWWSRQNCFNFWIYVAIWAWNWICKGSAAWLKKHWVHTSTAMLLFWAAKKHHVMDVTYFKSCIFSQKKTLIYFQTYSKVSTSKGQIISKGLFGVFKFSQKTNKWIRRSSKNEFVCSFFGRIRWY